MKKLLLTLFLFSALLVSPSSEDVVSLKVTFDKSNTAPATPTFKIAISPHKDNIHYCWGFVSNDAVVMYRRSCQQLNGIYSPIVIWQEYKNLGSGTYKAFVEIYRVPNRKAGESTFNFRILPALGE